MLNTIELRTPVGKVPSWCYVKVDGILMRVKSKRPGKVVLGNDTNTVVVVLDACELVDVNEPVDLTIKVAREKVATKC